MLHVQDACSIRGFPLNMIKLYSTVAHTHTHICMLQFEENLEHINIYLSAIVLLFLRSSLCEVQGCSLTSAPLRENLSELS